MLASAQVFAADDSWPYKPEDVSLVSDTAARIEGVTFGLANFERVPKGTQRLTEGAPPGYRVPIQHDANVVVVQTPERTIIHVDTDSLPCKQASFRLLPEDEAALWSLILALDESVSRGGATIAQEGFAPLLWMGSTLEMGAYRYTFHAKDSQGNRYVTVTPTELTEEELAADPPHASTLDLGDGVLWVDNALMLPADQVESPVPLGLIDRMAEFLGSIDFAPLWVSLKTGLVALCISLVLGLVAAWRVMGTSSRLKGLFDSVFTIPMVLPPTVCGFLLLMLFGNSTAVGRWLIDHGIEIVFTWPAAVIAAVVVSFPLVYRTSLGAFEALDAAMLDAARTLGWSEWRIFRFIMLPLAWPSIAAGAVLAFARAMGEFGCTLFFAGNYAGVTQTIPIAIYFEWMGGNTDVALFWVAVVIAFSFLVVLGINAYTARQQGYRRGGGQAPRRVCKRPVPGGADGAFGVRQARFESTEKPELRDDIDPCGGDAVRIDRKALRTLLANEEHSRKGGA